MPVFTWRTTCGKARDIMTADKAKSGATQDSALVISVHVCAVASCPGKDNIGHTVGGLVMAACSMQQLKQGLAQAACYDGRANSRSEAGAKALQSCAVPILVRS